MGSAYAATLYRDDLRIFVGNEIADHPFDPEGHGGAPSPEFSTTRFYIGYYKGAHPIDAADLERLSNDMTNRLNEIGVVSLWLE